jgi:cytoskeletal protein RodZ
MPGLGEEFRAAREARRLSLSDVSEQIHIRTVYLQSLEDEEWSAIAAPVYVRGFIRTYARFLGLNGEHAVAEFNASIGAQAKVEEHLVVSASGRRPSVWLWVASGVAVLLVAFVIYSYVQFQQNGGTSDAASTSVSSAAGSPEPASAAAAAVKRIAASSKHSKGNGKHSLQVRFTQSSWLLVKIDGTRALEGIFPPGTVKEFNGGKKAIIRAGNAGGVDLTVNGRSLGSMGKSGAVVDRTIGLAEE